MAALTGIPDNLKAIQPYLKIAEEHDRRDLVIAYWCRLYAVQAGLKIAGKSKDSSAFLISIMDWLEKGKKTNHDNEAITNEVVAQAYIENYALKLFLWADGEDRAGKFNKNVVKAFYTSGFIYDLVTTFGELSDEVAHHRKYAKWKATYIHNCLKNGISPVPGPVAMDEDEETNDSSFDSSEQSNQPQSGGDTFSTFQPPYPTTSFIVPSSKPMTLITPTPGAHAPPSTPSGSSQPSPSSSGISYIPPETSNGIMLNPEDFHKAQKYCKWAGSALQYEDVPTAIDNLQKALLLLTTGKDE